ncbi:L-2-hydroxyglutarate oxidase LhgO [Gemmata obscuriglobus]|uniref:L-2-hydroxyglutarate oxidase n=1 Tax=Gemmata obscuriglobus TaxID=114 RepID=A0A2Z3H7S8_9BACT|nr:L-2-hydroxyglutarate oxidase [Gemmata obscuriglobus]AWM39587.1 L-2-hydroxyglutarate oxidase [Gemmata obscuriglobus]QEG27316.1 L-2-hydroxyglutarate oxidase LhgO [Gemmata obscuriglobus]VTS04147.1 hydroxyglutarate oxidase : Putative dehydrogenase OS=Ignavibacterium album (strain DSM 19864 / JCM 16511 / NBRC 101810 / Mat9-16) GN=IALB_2667 PE=4 SV=1: DAO [Gemmata obscuriglobus UQM 2246]
MHTTDVLIVGGGIVGLGTGLALAGRATVTVIEAEGHLAQHQTGHNSGVIHSGLYYKPGSAKALNCAAGRELMYQFCAENGVPHDRCGKLVVATDESELPALAELERRGTANGLTGIRRLSAAEVREIEPHVKGVAALRVPETGIVDYKAVSEVYARKITDAGGSVHTSTQFLGCRTEPDALTVETNAGPVRAKLLVNCAGLHSDRVARLCGIEPGVRIVPFRGEYYVLKPRAQHLCRHLIYPVPDARLPFLGVHFTRMIGGGVECGPNAVLAFKREGYRFRDVDLSDLAELAVNPGFWKMARKFWRVGLHEMYRSLSRRAFWHALRKLIPEVSFHDLVPAGAGVRAQAVAPDGKLVDDFFVCQAPRMIHVLNAPSPAATASLAIGRSIADAVLKELA